MLFDARPAALPIAELRSRTWTASARARLRGAAAARWQWLRPRLLPAAVAIASAYAMFVSADYLSGFARDPARPAVASVAPATIVIEVGPPGATVFVDGKPIDRPLDLELKPSRRPLVILDGNSVMMR